MKFYIQATKIYLIKTFILSLVLFSTHQAYANRYQFDRERTNVEFLVGFLFGTVQGNFHEFVGDVIIEDDLIKSVEVKIQTASIDTGRVRRDDHLRSDHFFDVEQYPTLTFKSTKIESLPNDKYQITGDLTIRGKTKGVTLSGKMVKLEKKPKNPRYEFSAEVKINRQDWGVSWNQSASGRDLFIDDEIHILLKGQLIENGL